MWSVSLVSLLAMLTYHGAPTKPFVSELDTARAFARQHRSWPFAQGVRGTVLDRESRMPIAHASVELVLRGSGTALRSETDPKGVFYLEVDVPGEYVLKIESLGYRRVEQHDVTVPAGKIIVLSIMVSPEAQRLDPIVANTEIRGYHLEQEGFYRRQQEELGFFITPERLEERKPHRVTNLFFGVPGIRVIEPSGGGRGRAIMFGGTLQCWPMIYIDRHLVSTGGRIASGAELTAVDDIVFAPDLMAVEVYRTPAEIPSEFNGPNAGCGVVVLWTKKGNR